MKINKKILLTAIISGVLSSTITVAAVKLSASDVGFVSTDENWKATNVNEAMNDLYSFANQNNKNNDFKITLTLNTRYGGWDNGAVNTYSNSNNKDITITYQDGKLSLSDTEVKIGATHPITNSPVYIDSTASISNVSISHE